MTTPTDRLYGRGVAFPPGPVPPRCGWTSVSGPALLRQSLRLILETEPGERVMRPGFGCGLAQYLMAPNTPAVRSQVARDVEAAITLWEPRVAVQDVSVVAGEDPAVVLITVAYTAVRDGSADLLQVPFSLGAAVAPAVGGLA
jgi:uncharacterized protein